MIFQKADIIKYLYSSYISINKDLTEAKPRYFTLSRFIGTIPDKQFTQEILCNLKIRKNEHIFWDSVSNPAKA